MKVITLECIGQPCLGETITMLKLCSLMSAEGVRPEAYIATEDDALFQIIWDAHEEAFYLVRADGTPRIRLDDHFIACEWIVVGQPFWHEALDDLTAPVKRILVVRPDQHPANTQVASNPPCNLRNDFYNHWLNTQENSN